MILSAFEPKRSPFVYIQYAATGEQRRYEKTNIRKTDPDKARKIAKALNRIEARLIHEIPNVHGSVNAGWTWVSGYIRTRYAAKRRTAAIYAIQWNHLLWFLEESPVESPGELERAHAFEYLDWRQAQVKQKSKRHPSLNTALGELKLLALIMDEAIRRGLAIDNPVRKLGVQRDEPREKPEIQDTELDIIFAALRSRPVWMQRSFFLGLETGLRFSETRLSRSQIDWTGNRLIITKPKGGRGRAFSIQIYPSIEPVIRKFWESKDETFWKLPPQTLSGVVWRNFFDELGLDHICFHCTRVTFITRGARAGVPEAAMMKMTNHCSREVHRVYMRLADPDALRLRAQIQIPSFAAAIS